MSALRAPESASPPQNMHRALIFNGVTILAVTVTIFLFHGRQRRREKDLHILNVGRIHDSSNATGFEAEQGGGLLIALRHRVKGRRDTIADETAAKLEGRGTSGGAGVSESISDVEAAYAEDGKTRVEKGGAMHDVR